MIGVEIYGRTVQVPRAIDNDGAASGAWAERVRAGLEAALRAAGVPPRVVEVTVYEDGVPKVGPDGEVVVREVETWDAVPEAVWAGFTLPALELLSAEAPADVGPAVVEAPVAAPVVVGFSDEDGAE